MRILILGSSGGGKSSLAIRIHHVSCLPKLELDRLWFACGGQEWVRRGRSKPELHKIKRCIDGRVSQFMQSNENWVIDGVHSGASVSVIEQADKIILIDRPLLFRLVSHFIRILKGERRHPEVSIWEDLKFSGTIIKRWRNGERAHIMKVLTQYQDKLVVLNNFKAINKFYSSYYPE